MKHIQKLGQAKFKISTPGVAGSDLELNFQPIIDEFKLTGNYTLIHWQAKPKGHREWGIYTSQDDAYRSVEHLTMNLAIAKSLQLDDATVKTIPSAVLYTGEDKVTCINDKVIVGNVFLSDVA